MTRRIAAALALAGLLLLVAGSASGQWTRKEKKITERTVTGVVNDAEGNPVPGAVVQLKNMKTLAVRSFITREKGDFVFNGLSMDVDWEFKAESNGHFSAPRVVSTFDSHPQLSLILQLK